MKLSIDVGTLREKIGAFLDRDAEALEITPHRDWMITIIIFFALNMFGAVLGYALFIEVNKGDFVVGTKINPEELPAIDVKKLDSFLLEQETKHKQFQTLRSAPL